MGIQLITNTLKDIWPMLTIFLVVIVSIRLTYLHVNHERFVFYREFLNLVFVIYALLLYNLLTNSELNDVSGFNLIPFTEIMRYKIGTTGFYWNVIGNVLLFLPFGYFVSGYVKATKVSHILGISFITMLLERFLVFYFILVLQRLKDIYQDFFEVILFIIFYVFWFAFSWFFIVYKLWVFLFSNMDRGNLL